MTEIVNLSERRAPSCYTVDITHHWDGRVEVFVRDVADDQRSRDAVGHAIGLAAVAYGAAPVPQADAINRLLLKRIDVLMEAEAGTPESAELDELATAVQAYESVRYR